MSCFCPFSVSYFCPYPTLLLPPSCFFFYTCLCLHRSLSLASLPPLPPSPLTFALVEPEAQTHFSFSIFFMNNDIISKNCWRGKGLRALSGFDNTPLPHLSFSLWTKFGRCCLIFGKTVVADGEEVIMGFFVPLLTKTLQERQMRKMRSLQLSFPLYLPVLSFCPPFSDSLILLLLSLFPLLFLYLFLHRLPFISFYNFSLSPSDFPLACPPLWPSLLPSFSLLSLSLSLPLSMVLSGPSGSN